MVGVGPCEATKSFVSSGRRAMAASTSETISLTGMVSGVGANLGPFSTRMFCHG